MLSVFEFIGAFATLVFTGAAIYINLVEHPARMSCPTEIALQVWAPSYRLATRMQASLAVTGFLGAFMAWLLGGGLAWLAGALFILSVVPFTLIVIFPTNRKLLAPGRDPGSAETRDLLVRWGRLHAVRSALGLIASVILIGRLAGF